jgi:ubiquinone/menaquinone biosynthesis C-methylase UbiE
MYGTSEFDPVVKYYDLAFAAGATEDVAWISQEAQACGSPVLDLCCGTGRISLELARRGLQVTAVDSSSGMLGLFQQKLKNEPQIVRSRIDICEQHMENLHLDRQFRSVVCCDAFFHNLTPEAERSCLRSVNRHLLPDGLILFNIHNNPNPEFLSWASSNEAQKQRKRGEYPLPRDMGILTVFETLAHDPLNQRVDTTLHFTVTAIDGKVLEESESNWNARYLCKYEALYLLELCGFQVEAIYGGYCNEPVSLSSQLVFRARKIKDA